MTDIHVKQLDGCTYMAGGFNCTPACEAMFLWRASQGRIRTSACSVRTKTGDRSGGTTLAQMEQVSIAYGISGGRVYRPCSWDTVRSLISARRYGFILQVSYRRLAGTRYDCFSSNFRGNHALYVSGPGTVAGTWRVADPGADGRRPGIPTGYQDIPETLLKSAAGDLDLGGHKLGYGKAYIYATPPDPATSAPKYHASIIKPTSLWNNGTQKWVYNGENMIQPPKALIIRAASYTKGGVDCYPIDSTSPNYANYYIPKVNVKLGTRA